MEHRTTAALVPPPILLSHYQEVRNIEKWPQQAYDQQSYHERHSKSINSEFEKKNREIAAEFSRRAQQDFRPITSMAMADPQRFPDSMQKGQMTNTLAPALGQGQPFNDPMYGYKQMRLNLQQQLMRAQDPNQDKARKSPYEENRNSKCEACQAPANFMCSACKQVQYCSIPCQVSKYICRDI